MFYKQSHVSDIKPTYKQQSVLHAFALAGETD